MGELGGSNSNIKTVLLPVKPIPSSPHVTDTHPVHPSWEQPKPPEPQNISISSLQPSPTDRWEAVQSTSTGPEAMDL
ncbi:unnamed protein product [Gadus morhua 'NCC']